jgi:hypothetical protein
VRRRRWKWAEQSDEWPAFEAWLEALPWAEHVELAAGLEMLLDHGPEYDCPKLGDDLYVVYACSKQTIFWLIVGILERRQRRLVPLAWGKNPSSTLTEDVKVQALRKLQKCRNAI